MTRSIRLAVCLAALLSTGGALAQAPDAQTDENAAEAASSPVAHVYIGSGSRILAFSAAASGKLTPVPGSPFNYSLSLMGANGHYLFGFEPSSVIIDSLSMAANGALRKTATTNTEDYWPLGSDCPLTYWNGQGLRIDHSGEDLYNAAIPVDGFCYSNFQSFKINDANGKLTYLGETDKIFYGGPQLSILGNDEYAYSPNCAAAFGNSPSPSVTVFQRISSGELVTVNAGADIPAAPMDTSYPGGPVPGYYCPLTMATDPANHAAMTLNAFDNVDGGDGEGDFYGPVVIAAFTADAKGNLKTTSTYKNMAVAETGGGTMRMSPSGKLLAVGGSGLEIFHFNGGSPLTKYKTLLTTDGIGQILWDNDNHMYALGSDTKGTGKLWVYTVTPTSLAEAPGSPYSITNAGGMVVQTLK
jgi:hypothetical protein